MIRGLALGAAALALLVAGVVTGVAAVALHTRGWGFALVALATLLGLAALPPGWSTRVAFAVGWEVVVLRAALGKGPGGDVVVSADLAGYALLVLALVVALAALLTLASRRRVAAGSRPEESGQTASSA